MISKINTNQIESALYQKIVDLFEYRQFPLLYSLAEVDVAQASLLNEKLIFLQAQIYYLDEYLESNWTLNSDRLDYHWQAINDALAHLAIPVDKARSYCKHILKYQKHEEQLRSGRLPTRLSMEYFYFYKSCDVKLIRRLIYENFPKLKQYSTLADWRYFDLITEVNDDVMDVFEDLETINGNRFLIALHHQNDKDQLSAFQNFFKYISQMNAEHVKSDDNALKTRMFQLTDQNIKETKELFVKNISTFTKDGMKYSQLFNHLERTNG